MITDRDAFDSTRLGLEVGYALEKLYPGKIPWDTNRFLIGNHEVIAGGEGRVQTPATPFRKWRIPRRFRKRREKYLLYR